MSFLVYLCWLLGISAPSDCDTNSNQAWATNACEPAEQSEANVPKDDGQRNAQRHSDQRTTNISVSI